jgi:hypothetical protein
MKGKRVVYKMVGYGGDVDIGLKNSLLLKGSQITCLGVQNFIFANLPTFSEENRHKLFVAFPSTSTLKGYRRRQFCPLSTCSTLEEFS